MFGKFGKYPAYLLAFAFVFLAVMHFSTGKALAATKSYYEVISNCRAGYTPGVSPCQTVTILPHSDFDIWDASGANTVRVGFSYICVTGDESFTISGPIVSGQTNYSSACVGKPLGSTGSGSIMVRVNTPVGGGFNGVYHAVVTINAVNPPSWDRYAGGHVAVTMSVGDGDNVDILAGATSWEHDPSGSSWPDWARAFGQYSGGEDFRFKVPCDYSSSYPVWVAWSGADQNEGYQNRSLNWALTDLTTGTQVTIRSGNGLGSSGSSNVYSAWFYARAGDVYQWKWNSLTPANEMGFSLPFSENSRDLNLQCTWHLAGNSTVTKKTVSDLATPVTFNHSVTSLPASTKPADFDWHLEGIYYSNGGTTSSGWGASQCGKNGTVSNGATPCGLLSGSYSGLNPNTSTPRYAEDFQFPSNAQNHDKYCQRVAFTNPNGPGGFAYSNPVACVEYAISPTFHFDPTTPKPTVSGTLENPGTVKFTGDSGYSPPSPYPTLSCIHGAKMTYSIYKQDRGGAKSYFQQNVDVPSGSDCLGEQTITYTTPSIAPNSVQAGDQYCIDLRVNYDHGDADSSGNIVPGTTGGPAYANNGDPNPNCITITNQPYANFYGADVIAGQGFANSGACTDSAGSIETYSNSNNNPVTLAGGSGSQFAAISNDQIQGFSSAILREGGPDPNGPLGLTFANTVSINGGALPAVNMGGNLNYTSCIPDYYGSKTASTIVLSPADNLLINPATAMTGSFSITPPSGTLQLRVNGGGIHDGKSIVLYVDGNVEITGSGINYQGTSWGSLDQIPSLYLIVKGNIFIDPSVTELDGLYVAQPDSSGNGGNIYDCYSGDPNNPSFQGPGSVDSSMYDQCHNQLVINGAFVSQATYLDRTFGSLRNSIAKETMTNNGQTCSNQGGRSTNSCAAEVFNFSPEIYIATPGLSPSSGPALGIYDDVTSLPPVL